MRFMLDTSICVDYLRGNNIMTGAVDSLVLEHLKKIQAEQSALRERDAEIMSRLAHIETGIARIARDESTN